MRVSRQESDRITYYFLWLQVRRRTFSSDFILKNFNLLQCKLLSPSLLLSVFQHFIPRPMLTASPHHSCISSSSFCHTALMPQSTLLLTQRENFSIFLLVSGADDTYAMVRCRNDMLSYERCSLLILSSFKTLLILISPASLRLSVILFTFSPFRWLFDSDARFLTLTARITCKQYDSRRNSRNASGNTDDICLFISAIFRFLVIQPTFHFLIMPRRQNTPTLFSSRSPLIRLWVACTSRCDFSSPFRLSFKEAV